MTHPIVRRRPEWKPDGYLSGTAFAGFMIARMMFPSVHPSPHPLLTPLVVMLVFLPLALVIDFVATMREEKYWPLELLKFVLWFVVCLGLIAATIVLSMMTEGR